ncbi:MAG: hypothetical protein M3384_14185 [Acidobacteriota bacterium]|nr:hypothetical protein [Acidobacteriota bacterium]
MENEGSVSIFHFPFSVFRFLRAGFCLRALRETRAVVERGNHSEEAGTVGDGRSRLFSCQFFTTAPPRPAAALVSRFWRD